MPGLADLAVGVAPIAGGLLLGTTAGYLRGPDIRGAIKQDLDVLDRLPPEQVERRAELQRSIDMRIDDLIATVDRNRALRNAAASYRGGWRDIVLFICTLLFTAVWWDVNHHKSNWLPMFVVLILASILTAGYALRGVYDSMANVIRRDGRPAARRQPKSDGDTTNA